MASGYFLLNREELKWEYVKKKVCAIVRIIVLWNVLRYIIKIIGSIYKSENLLEYSPIKMIVQIIESVLQKGKMWQFWYLGSLILIYCCLPILSKIFVGMKKHKRIRIEYKWLAWCIFVLVSILIQVTSMLIGTPLQQGVIQTFRVWSWLQYFCMGGLVPSLAPTIKRKVPSLIHFLLVCVSTVFVVWYQGIVGNYILDTIYPEYFYDSVFFMVWVFIIFTFGLRIKFTEFQVKCVLILNELTLGVYCIHPIVISNITRFVVLEDMKSSIIIFISVLFISFVLVGMLSKINIFKKYYLCI